MTSGQASIDITELLGSRVEGIQEYAPEPLEETARRLGRPVTSLIKLDANENPYGPTPGALEALREYDQYHRYPDPTSRRLIESISRYVDVPQGHILAGNGSDELISLLLALFRPGRDGGGIAEVIDCPPTFGMYSFYASANDMHVLQVPRRPDFALDIDGIEALCRRDPRPRVVFVASPNNPDGLLLPEDTLQRLLALPLLVVLDEAYVEFSGSSRARWVPEYRNLIVLRTFSKWAGLAGLRLGYGLFPGSVAEALRRLKSPYNVNGPAQAAALATLERAEEASERVQHIIQNRNSLYERLAGISGVLAYPSAANYILLRLERGTPAGLRAHMEARGILLRYYGGGSLEQCVRVSVGTPEQNAAMVAALEEYVRTVA